LYIIASLVFYNCESNAEIDLPETTSQITNLLFSEVYAFDDNLLGGPYIGMVNSNSENSLFISCRENEPSSTITEEEVFKLNLDSNELIRKNTLPGGFITKQLAIENNQLVSIGGTEIKVYDLSLQADPSTIEYQNNFTLSKYGIARDNSGIYIIGGYRVDTPTRENKKIYKLNINSSELFEEVITTPETMMGASAAIVNEKMYVFGGALYEDWEPTNKIFIYPLNGSPSYEELRMSLDADITFVHRYGDLILIAGHKGLLTGNKTSFVAKFDTNTNIFEEIETNLDSNGGVKAIHQMTIKNDTMYILFGHKGISPTNISNWSIMTASLKSDQ